MKRRAFVVELTGARGVGKSTVAAALKLELRERGIDCDPRVRRRLLNRLRDRVRGAFLTGTALLSFTGWRPASVTELSKLLRRYRSLCMAMGRADEHGGVHVIDEGLCHLALTTYIKTANKDMISLFGELARRVRLPDVVVLVVGSEEVVAQRRSQRSNAGDRRTPRVSLEGQLALRALEDALEATQAGEPDLTYLRIDNEFQDGRRAAKLIADTIARQLAARPNSEVD